MICNKSKRYDNESEVVIHAAAGLFLSRVLSRKLIRTCSLVLDQGQERASTFHFSFFVKEAVLPLGTVGDKRM